MIEVRNLTKRFGSRVAVNDLTFQAADGRITGLLGPNGAGKTTVLRTLLGLVASDEGSATFDGKLFTRAAEPMRLAGVLLDARAVHPGRSGYQHLTTRALTHGIGTARVLDVLDRVGLETAADTPIRKYSLGMLQRLGLAAALLGEPRHLVLDEPVNGLDPDGVLWLRSMLRELADDGCAVLLSSHLMAELERTVDDIVIVARGALLHASSLDQLASRGGSIVLVKSSEDDLLTTALRAEGASVARAAGCITARGLDATTIGTICRELGLVLSQLETRGADLEDSYLELTAELGEFSAH